MAIRTINRDIYHILNLLIQLFESDLPSKLYIQFNKLKMELNNYSDEDLKSIAVGAFDFIACETEPSNELIKAEKLLIQIKEKRNQILCDAYHLEMKNLKSQDSSKKSIERLIQAGKKLSI